MHPVIQRNTDNMTALWRHYSAQSVALSDGRLMYSTYWPHKVWIEGKVKEHEHAYVLHTVSQLLRQNPMRAWATWAPSTDRVASVFAASQYQPITQSTLVGMSLDLGLLEDTLVTRTATLKQHSVKASDVRVWSALCSKGFGYPIDEQAIHSALTHPDNILHWYSCEGQPVGTSLIALTGATAGFHQITVVPLWRGKGMAGEIVRQMLAWAVDNGAGEAVLQASHMGQGVYKKLGFSEDFRLEYYKHAV